MYTSTKISKLLAENGCKLKSKYYRDRQGNLTKNYQGSSHNGDKYSTSDIVKYYPAYDILYDICIKYVKEFFQGDKEDWADSPIKDFPIKFFVFNIKEKIFGFVCDNKSQKAEDYFWKHCKFNPNNK